MKETMMTYIDSQKEVNTKIIKNRCLYLKEAIEILKNNNSGRWIILATGSSANAIECAKYYVEEVLNISIEIKMPFVFSNYNYHIDKEAIYFAVTQSGQSFSTIEALKRVKSEKCEVFTMTSNLKSPIIKENKKIIEIGCGEEKVGYVTKGVSATALTFMLLGLEVAYIRKKITKKQYIERLNNLESVIELTDQVIKESLIWYEKNKNEFINCEKILAIGYGPGYGIAKEADTKITETVRIPMRGVELEEFMHGPYLALDNKDNILFIETKNKLMNRQRELRKYFDKYIDNSYKITFIDEEEKNDKNLYLKCNLDENESILLFLIPMQVLSYKLSMDKGIDLSKKIFIDFDDVLKSKI